VGHGEQFGRRAAFERARATPTAGGLRINAGSMPIPLDRRLCGGHRLPRGGFPLSYIPRTIAILSDPALYLDVRASEPFFSYLMPAPELPLHP